MKFVGALIWALGDPDQSRSLNVFHPLSGVVSSTTRFRRVLGYFLPLAVYALLYFLTASAKVRYSEELATYTPLVIMLAGFLKLPVSSVIRDMGVRKSVLSEGCFIMFLSGVFVYFS
ncbi:hypothetical protein N9W79_00880 [bacterium]|nr:hypothetical protein [bacterium]